MFNQGTRKIIYNTFMYIKVRVVASARKEEVAEESADHFLIKVKEPAKQNLANVRIRQIIASRFNVSVLKVRIINGHHSPSKLLVVDTEE